MNASKSPLALYHGVDFEVVDTTMILDEPYAGELKSGKLTGDNLELLLRRHNNVATEIQINLKVNKAQA